MSRYPTITPHLAIADIGAALDFYPKAFGAEERLRLAAPDGTVVHAELLFGGDLGGLVTMGAALEAFGLAAPDPAELVQVAITFFTDDVDAGYERAVAAGATGVSEPTDQFHGDRTATVRCPFGHKWILAQHLRDVPQDAQQEALNRMFGG